MHATDPDTHVCEVCGARVATLRRGRCWICYVRWADTRPVGLGAACAVCFDRRRDNLRMVEFQGSWYPMCHNCSSKTLQLAPVPRTLEGVRQRLGRDRRWKEQRVGKKEHRIFAIERRREERRDSPVRDADSEWLDAEELIVEMRDAGELDEATRITKPDEKERRESL